MKTYEELSMVEKLVALSNFGENKNNMLYDFENLRAIEMDNDGNEVSINYEEYTIDDLPF